MSKMNVPCICANDDCQRGFKFSKPSLQITGLQLQVHRRADMNLLQKSRTVSR
jgi:hypothetical protein